MAGDAAGLIVFGSGADPGVPAGVRYQRLQHPDGLGMTKILDWDLYDGKVYAIAQYSDGTVHHFYDGAYVADWGNGKVRTGMVNNSGIASHLATLIQADAVYTTTVLAAVITVEAAVAGVPFDISALAENVTGGNNNQTATPALVTPNVTAIAETLATVFFDITAGTNSAGVNALNSITIAGVEVLGAVVDWVTSNNTTAANIAAQINTYVSAPEYSAVAVAQRVTISAAAGTGAGPNGFTVVIDPIGNVGVDGGAGGANVTKNLAGGVAGVAGQKQKNTVTIGGTFEVGDKFTVTIDNKKFGYTGNPFATGTLVKTHRRKLYSPAGSVMNFCGVEAPLGWNSIDDAGAGFINMATHQSGSAQLTGMAVYQDKLAIFARRVVQIWNMQDDDALNTPFQFITQTGTRAPASVIEYGDLDVFYLADSGVRSLRARAAINIASVQDVGKPIDKLVRAWVKTQSAAIVEAAVGAVEPEENRFWLAIGTRIFVFSYFPTNKISAWTWYDIAFTPEQFVLFDDRIYARSGNAIYLYGGDGDATYCTTAVKVSHPFLSVKKEGTYKQLTGMDIAARGSWDCKVLVDPNRDDDARAVNIGALAGFTYQGERNMGVGHFTHLAPILEFAGGSYASISKLTLYYSNAEARG